MGKPLQVLVFQAGNDNASNAEFFMTTDPDSIGDKTFIGRYDLSFNRPDQYMAIELLIRTGRGKTAREIKAAIEDILEKKEE